MTNNNPDRNAEKVGEKTSIYLRGKTWWVSYQLDGSQRRESLKTSSKKEARRKALIIELELQHGNHEPPPPQISISELIDEYLAHLKVEERAKKTLDKYRTVLDRVRDKARADRLVTLMQINLRFVDQYRSERKAAECAAKTIYGETTIIRQLINFAKSRRLLRVDPLKGLRNPKPRPTKQPCWSPSEVETILTNASEPQKSIYLALADTGMRIGEVQWLTWGDVDFANNKIHIQPKDGWKPKSGDAREVPMTPRLRKMLAARPHTAQWVFTAGVSKKYPSGGNQISERRLLVSLKRLLKRLGLSEAGKLHTFRHSFISDALANGISTATVRAWVGHVSEEILKLYTHVLEDQSQAAMQIFAETKSDGKSSTDLTQSRKRRKR